MKIDGVGIILTSLDHHLCWKNLRTRCDQLRTTVLTYSEKDDTAVVGMSFDLERPQIKLDSICIDRNIRALDVDAR